MFLVMIYSDFLWRCVFHLFGERSLQIFFRRDLSSFLFCRRCSSKILLVEVSSEICFIGISLQRMVNMSPSKGLVGDNSFHFFW